MEFSTQVVLAVTAGLKWPYVINRRTHCRRLLAWLLRDEHLADYNFERAMLMAREVILAQHPNLAREKPEGSPDHYEWWRDFNKRFGAPTIMLAQPADEQLQRLKAQFPHIGRATYAGS